MIGNHWDNRLIIYFIGSLNLDLVIFQLILLPLFKTKL